MIFFSSFLVKNFYIFVSFRFSLVKILFFCRFLYGWGWHAIYTPHHNPHYLYNNRFHIIFPSVFFATLRTGEPIQSIALFDYKYIFFYFEIEAYTIQQWLVKIIKKFQKLIEINWLQNKSIVSKNINHIDEPVSVPPLARLDFAIGK